MALLLERFQRRKDHLHVVPNIDVKLSKNAQNSAKSKELANPSKFNSEITFFSTSFESRKWRNYTALTSEFQSWDSASYFFHFIEEFERLMEYLRTIPESKHSEVWTNFLESFRNMLREDFDGYAREYLLRQCEIDVPSYKLTQENTVTAGYSKSLEGMAKNLIDKLAQMAAPLDRAEAEDVNIHRVRKWGLNFVMGQIRLQLQQLIPENGRVLPTALPDLERQIRQSLVTSDALNSQVRMWISPPGEKPTYMGTTSKYDFTAQEEFTSMLYVFNIKNCDFHLELNPTTHRVHPMVDNLEIGCKVLVGRPNYQRIIEIQEQFGRAPHITSSETADSDIIRNMIRVKAQDTPVGNYANNYDRIYKHIHRAFFHPDDVAKWPIGPQHSPLIQDEAHFWKQAHGLFEQFYVPTAEKLFVELAEKTLQDPQYRFSLPAQKMIEKLDATFLHVDSPLCLFVHTNDQNPLSRQIMERKLAEEHAELTKQGIKLDFKKQNHVNIRKIQKFHQLYIHHVVDKKPISKEDKKWMQANAGSTLWLLGGRGDLVQCGGVAVAKIAFELLGGSMRRFGDFLVPSNLKVKHEPNRKCSNPECKTPHIKRFAEESCGLCLGCDNRVKHAPEEKKPIKLPPVKPREMRSIHTPSLEPKATISPGDLLTQFINGEPTHAEPRMRAAA